MATVFWLNGSRELLLNGSTALSPLNMKQQSYASWRFFLCSVFLLTSGLTTAQFLGLDIGSSGIVDPAILNQNRSNNSESVISRQEHFDKIVERHRMEDDLKSRQEYEKKMQLVNQITSYYNGFLSYPLNVDDGWHEVVMIDESQLDVFTVKAYVSGNKLMRFDDQPFSYVPQTIFRGRCRLHVTLHSGDIRFIEIMFLNYIAEKQ